MPSAREKSRNAIYEIARNMRGIRRPSFTETKPDFES